MDRLDEDYIESDLIHRDPDVIQVLLDNHCKVFAKYLNDVIKFYDKVNTQTADNIKATAKVYGTLRSSLQNANRMPLKAYFEMSAIELSQHINPDERLSEAQQAFEEMKHIRTKFAGKCKNVKEQWKQMKTRYAEAQEAHRNARTNYIRIGRDLDKLVATIGEESGSFGSNDLLDHLGGFSDAFSTSSSKRERQRVQMEAKFKDAEHEYKEAVRVLRKRIIERTRCHTGLLSSIKHALTEAETGLKRTQDKLLRLSREQAAAKLESIDRQLHQVKDFQPGSCYLEWANERLSAPYTPQDEESNVAFVPYSSYVAPGREGLSHAPISPPVTARLHQSSGDVFPNRRSTDLLLDVRRDSADGSSEGSTPGSTRHGHFRSSEDIAPHKSLESTPTEEEIRPAHAPVQNRSSWLQKTFKWWSGSGNIRGGSAGGSGNSSPPPTCHNSPVVEERLREVQPVIRRCITALDELGLTTEGLYRKPGKEARTKGLFNDMISNPNSISLSEQTPVDITTIIKKCLKRLKDPLFTENLHHEFVRISAFSDGEIALEELKKVIRSLPPTNYEIASDLMHHLNKVAKTEENCMNYENLGTCLAPTVFYQRNLGSMNSASAKNSRDILATTDVKECSRVLAMIIENADVLFDGPAPCPHASNSLTFTTTVTHNSQSNVTYQSTTTTTQVIGDENMIEEVTRTTVDGDVASVNINYEPLTSAPKETLSESSAPGVLCRTSLTETLWSSESSGRGPTSSTSGSSPPPPPVPPALGRRKPSSEKSKKIHEVRLRSRFTATNARSCHSEVFDDRVLLADVYAGSGRPDAFQMIDSSDDESSSRSYSSVFY